MPEQVNLPRLPSAGDNADRIAVIGQTGSGKTYAALWHLSLMPLEDMAFLVINFKRDRSIDSIPYAKHINVGDPITLPGVYIVHPRPIKEDRQALTAWLWDLLEQGNVGILADEGFMMKDDPAFETILMQGRSKNMPVIVNAQRPVWLSRFVFTESGFVQVFFLGDLRDQDTLSNFTPIYRDESTGRLPKFHSWYYDVSEDRLHHFKPVPDMRTIMQTFETKLKPKEVLQEKVKQRVYI